MANLNQISFIKIGGTKYEIKDTVARQTAAGGLAFLGVTGSTLTDHSPAGAVTINGNAVTPIAGNMVIDANGREFVAAPTGTGGALEWNEFGRGSEFGAMAFADSADVSIASHTHSISYTDEDLTHQVTGGSASVTGKFTPEGEIADISYTPAGTMTNPTISVSGGTNDVALGEATTFTAAPSTVTFTNNTTKDVLTTAVTATVPKPSLSNATKSVISASLSTSSVTPTKSGTTKAITALNTSSLSLTKSNMDQTSVGSASDWNAGTMFEAEYGGTAGADAETLILTAGAAPSLTVTPTTVGAGTVSADGTGAPVGTALDGPATVATGVKSSSEFVTGVSYTAPTVSLASKTGTAGTGEVAVVTAQGTLSDSGTNAVTFDTTTAGKTANVISALGTGTAAAQAITVGTNDKVTAVTGIGTITATGTAFKGTAATLSTTFTGTEGDITASGNVSGISVTKHTYKKANATTGGKALTGTATPAKKAGA